MAENLELLNSVIKSAQDTAKAKGKTVKNADDLVKEARDLGGDAFKIWDEVYDDDKKGGNHISGQRYFADGNNLLFQSQADSDGLTNAVSLYDVSTQKMKKITDKSEIIDLLDTMDAGKGDGSLTDKNGLKLSKEKILNDPKLKIKLTEDGFEIVGYVPPAPPPPPPPPKNRDPIGFNTKDGKKVTFIDDENKNGHFDGLEELAGIDNDFLDLDQYSVLDSEGKKVITGDKLKELMVLVENPDGTSELVSAEEAGIKCIYLDNNKEFKVVDGKVFDADGKELVGYKSVGGKILDPDGNILGSTFKVVYENETITGTQTYDSEEYLNARYADDIARDQAKKAEEERIKNQIKLNLEG